jgi:chromate transporter
MSTNLKEIPALLLVFGYLSLLTVGGGMAAYPEMQTLVVDVHHWLTEEQLIHFYSVGQLAPGPNMMMVAAIGEKVAGPLASLLVVVAFFLPTALMTFVVGKLWTRAEHWPWRESIRKGLAPVSVGLILSGCISMAKVALAGWLSVVVSVAVFGILLKSKVNPAFLILGGAIVGYFWLKG